MYPWVRTYKNLGIIKNALYCCVCDCSKSFSNELFFKCTPGYNLYVPLNHCAYNQPLPTRSSLKLYSRGKTDRSAVELLLISSLESTSVEISCSDGGVDNGDKIRAWPENSNDSGSPVVFSRLGDI